MSNENVLPPKQFVERLKGLMVGTFAVTVRSARPDGEVRKMICDQLERILDEIRDWQKASVNIASSPADVGQVAALTEQIETLRSQLFVVGQHAQHVIWNCESAIEAAKAMLASSKILRDQTRGPRRCGNMDSAPIDASFEVAANIEEKIPISNVDKASIPPTPGPGEVAASLQQEGIDRARAAAFHAEKNLERAIRDARELAGDPIDTGWTTVAEGTAKAKVELAIAETETGISTELNVLDNATIDPETRAQIQDSIDSINENGKGATLDQVIRQLREMSESDTLSVRDKASVKRLLQAFENPVLCPVSEVPDLLMAMASSDKLSPRQRRYAGRMYEAVKDVLPYSTITYKAVPGKMDEILARNEKAKTFGFILSEINDFVHKTMTHIADRRRVEAGQNASAFLQFTDEEVVAEIGKIASAPGALPLARKLAAAALADFQVKYQLKPHVHCANGVNDACLLCGKGLRDDIHQRMEPHVFDPNPEDGAVTNDSICRRCSLPLAHLIHAPTANATVELADKCRLAELEDGTCTAARMRRIAEHQVMMRDRIHLAKTGQMETGDPAKDVIGMLELMLDEAYKVSNNEDSPRTNAIRAAIVNAQGPDHWSNVMHDFKSVGGVREDACVVCDRTKGDLIHQDANADHWQNIAKNRIAVRRSKTGKDPAAYIPTTLVLEYLNDMLGGEASLDERVKIQAAIDRLTARFTTQA